MSVFDQVKRYAKQVKKFENWIYVNRDLNVYLIDKLPEKYYKKTDILIVDDPYKYLLEINKRKPTQKELDQFELVTRTEEVIYADIVPPELIREKLLKLPIQDIVKNRRISKEYKGIIDDNKFWCELYERDYPKEKYDKTKCNEEYKRKFLLPKITLNQIKDVSKKYNVDEIDIIDLLERIHFRREANTWYFDPKSLFKDIVIFIIGEKYFIEYSEIQIINNTYNFYKKYFSPYKDNIERKYQFNRDRLKDFLSKNVYPAIKDILPYPFTIKLSSIFILQIEIKIKDYFDLYSKIYQTLDKDLIEASKNILINDMQLFLNTYHH